MTAFLTRILELFHDGGALMWVNLLVLAFGLAVVAERFFVLTFRLRINTKSFLTVVEKLIGAGNFDRATKLCTLQGAAAVPRVVRAALVSARLGGSAVQASIDEAMAEVVPLVTKRAGLLWGIANLATLIGLVGTVLGLITAFDSISSANPDQKSTLLTEGIAHAMANTFFGLFIAVICVFFHMMLSLMVKNILDGLEYASVRIENILARRRLAVTGRVPAGQSVEGVPGPAAAAGPAA